MNIFDLKNTLSFVAITLIITINTSEVFAAGKGWPGSTDREDWCFSKLRSCIDDAQESCSQTYGNDNSDRALCDASEVLQCKNSYGGTSDCLTRDLVSPSSNRQKKIDNTGGVLAPAESNSSAQESQLQRKQTKKPANSKNAPQGSN